MATSNGVRVIQHKGMAKVLSDAQVAQFHEQGYLSGLDVFSATECDEFRARAEAFEYDRPNDVAWAFDIKCNLLFDWVYRISAHPNLVDSVEDLIGPDILLTNSIFRIKEPQSPTHYGWHQDAARIQVEPNFIIAYLAIGDATTDNGCLKVIPNSQSKIEPFHLVGYSNRKLARVTSVDESTAVDLILKKGQVGFFHCNTIHGSGVNTSGARRFALINDYTPAAARQSISKGSGQLLRGKDDLGNWGVEPLPSNSFDDNARIRRSILNQFPENVLMGPLDAGATPSFADRPH
ncbi:MAG: phytanoyl-CoA dioxygenase family protein [Pseudomonadota bacterium]